MKLAGPVVLFSLFCGFCIYITVPIGEDRAPLVKLFSSLKQEKVTRPAQNTSLQDVKVSALDTRAFTISKDQNGHFSTSAKINSRRVSLLIDTGASTLALTAKDARAAGLRPSPGDYIIRVSTANGTVHAAQVKIRRLEIGPFILKNIDALVLPEEALDITLLGMNVLSEFGRVEIKDNALILATK